MVCTRSSRQVASAIWGGQNMSCKIRRFFADESGATAIEYALIAGGISIVIVATVYNVGNRLNAMFTSISNGFN
jgi:pilus assembly protein Flp/PilA